MVVFVGIRFINKKFIGTYMLAALVLIAVAELTFGLSGHLSEALGRGSELSGRKELWARLSGNAHQSDFWDWVRKLLVGRQAKAADKEFSFLSQTRPITAIWRSIWN